MLLEKICYINKMHQHSAFCCLHAGHWWRSGDELISDVFLWTPSHGRAKAGRPARTYIQQLCADKGFIPEDLLKAMDDGERFAREGQGYPCWWRVVMRFQPWFTREGWLLPESGVPVRVPTIIFTQPLNSCRIWHIVNF